MRGSAAFRTSVTPGGALAGPWVRNPLWTAARAVPSLDLRFADNKSLVDATTGQNLVTFTRASSGTYVDSQGVIRTATTNLQTWSEDFRNTADAGATRPWVYNTSAVTTDNTAAPNGTSTADLIAGATGTTNKFLTNNISTTTIGFYTFSIYLKQGTEQFVVIRLTDGSANGIRGRFDLAAGTVVITNEGTATGQAASATSVGNGWYRCVVTCSVSSLPSSVMQPQLWLNNFASTSLTTNYYAWGAQLEQSSTVGEYIPTTSTINSAPRFDHNPTTGESLGLLVEEQRTNLLVQSSFGSIGTTTANNTWYETFAELDTTVNAGLAPDGTTTAALLSINTPTSFRSVIQRTTSTTAGTYALSIYLKPNSTDTSARVMLSGDTGASNFVRADFTLSGAGTAPGSAGVGGTAVSAAAPAIQALPNGWYRCTIAGTLTAPTGITVFVYPGTTGSQTTNSQTLVWGAQLEAGAFPTSYIPTTTATVTRSADVASITGSNFSSWYRQDEGTVFVNASAAVAASILPCYVSFDNGTTSERLQLRRVVSGTNPSYRVVASGQSIDSATKSIGSPAGFNSQILAYASNNYEGACNGVLEGLISIANRPAATQTQIGAGAGNAILNGTIRRLTYWPTRLPNATLQQITQ